MYIAMIMQKLYWQLYCYRCMDAAKLIHTYMYINVHYHLHHECTNDKLTTCMTESRLTGSTKPVIVWCNCHPYTLVMEPSWTFVTCDPVMHSVFPVHLGTCATSVSSCMHACMIDIIVCTACMHESYCMHACMHVVLYMHACMHACCLIHACMHACNHDVYIPFLLLFAGRSSALDVLQLPIFISCKT